MDIQQKVGRYSEPSSLGSSPTMSISKEIRHKRNFKPVIKLRIEVALLSINNWKVHNKKINFCP